MRFDIIPHIGASNLKLGMTRDEVRTLLGIPGYSSEKITMEYDDFSLPLPAKDGYFENELQITFDDDNKIEFIEFSGKDAVHIKVFLNEVEVFKVPAPELVLHIISSTKSDYDKEDEEIPFSYIFPEIDLSVWRPVIPELDEEMGEIPEFDEGKYFSTIGIGIRGYY